MKLKMLKQKRYILLFEHIRRCMRELVFFRQNLLSPNCTQAEGFALGVAAKMFTIAGPVIVYGLSAGVVYGFIYWFIRAMI